jgi:hypothetical protein
MKFLIVLLLLPFTVMAQTWTWGMKGTGNHQPGNDMEIVAFNDGSTVVAGYFQKELKLGEFRLYTDDNYYSDIFLARVNSEGKVLWAKQMDAGSSYGSQLGLAIDDDRNIYLTGAQSGYMYVAKYDSTGTVIWNNNFNYKYYGHGASIATDKFDNVYVLGGKGSNLFASRLNYNGKTEWIQNISVNSSQGISIRDMKVDDDGNMYFAGTYSVDSIRFDHILIQQKGSAVWGKISPHGKFLWAKAASGSVNNACVALSGNTLYISGSFNVEMKIGGVTLPGLCCSNPKPFIARFDTAGNQIWAKTGTTTYENKGTITTTKADQEGNLYVAGGYFTCYGTYCTESDYFVEKYNRDGSALWRVDFNHANGDACSSIDFDANGHLYLAGRTMAADFTNSKSESAINSYGIGKINTGQPTPKRIERPKANRIQYTCSGDDFINLQASGQNLKWYDDEQLTLKVHEGPTYVRAFTSTDTVYVTQTIGSNESRPGMVIAYRPPLDSYTITYQKDTLAVPFNDRIAYRWYYNSEQLENADRHFIIPNNSGIYEVELTGGSCIKRLSFDFQRPAPPVIDSHYHFCTDEPAILYTTGENISWYYSTNLNDVLGVGNSLQLNERINRNIVVRQTVNGIISKPKQVLVSFSQLRASVISSGPTTLSVQNNSQFNYQWSFNNEPLSDSTAEITPQRSGRYSVTISDGPCSRTMSTYFVKQPAFEKTNYFICPSDTLPTLKATGNDILWLTPGFTSLIMDTLARGPEFTPPGTNLLVLVVDNDSSFSSFPVMLVFTSLNATTFNVTKSGNSLYIESSALKELSYTWYRDNDPVAVSTTRSIYAAPFGNYYVNVSFNNQCDTLIHYPHFPAFDSIQYICSDRNPSLYVADVQLEWYADEALTQKRYTGYYFKPSAVAGDTVSYVVQRTNGKVNWRGKVAIRYPDFSQITLKQEAERLTVTPAQPYYKYRWIFNNKEVLPDTTASIVPVEEGEYRVDVGAGNCYATLNQQFVRSGIIPVGSDGRFRISPNPATDFLWIENTHGADSRVALKLYNLNGQLTTAYDAIHLPYRLNTQLLKPGIYVLEIQTKTSTFRSKIVVRD